MSKYENRAPFIFLVYANRVEEHAIVDAICKYRLRWTREALVKFSLSFYPLVEIDHEKFAVIPRWAEHVARLIELSFADGKGSARRRDGLWSLLKWLKHSDNYKAAWVVAQSLSPTFMHAATFATVGPQMVSKSHRAVALKLRRAIYAMAGVPSS